MAQKSSYLISGLAAAAVMIAALPAAKSLDASTKQIPNIQVNRGAKGDRLTEPHSIAVKKAPTDIARETVKNPVSTDKRAIMDGCDPLFSPVTVPTMAHIAGRCVG